MSKKQAFALVVFLLLGLTLVLATQIVIRSQHTLYHRPDLIHTKNLSTINNVGAIEFLISRNTLAKDQLNLSAWYGHHEIHYHGIPKTVQEVELSVLADPKGRFEVAFGNSETYEARLTLQKDGVLESALKITADGEQTRIPLSYDPQGNTELQIKWTTTGLWINNQELYKESPPLQFFPPFKLQSADRQLAIKEVIFSSREGHRHTLNFKPQLNILRPLLINIGLFVLVALLFIKASKMAYISFLIVQLSCMTIYAFVDYFYLAPLPYSVATKASEYQFHQSQIPLWEKTRYRFFQLWFRAEKDYPTKAEHLVHLNYPAPKIWEGITVCQGRCRFIESESELDEIEQPLIFVGTSQTFGMGASDVTQTYIAGAYQQLSKNHLPFVVLANPGSTGAQLYAQFSSTITDLSPRGLIINLGLNDSTISEQQLASSLENFDQLASKLNIPIVYMVEGRSPDYGGNDEEPYIKITRDFARRQQRPLWDWNQELHSAMLKEQKDLWFDAAHLNPIGHQVGASILARWLADWIERI